MKIGFTGTRQGMTARQRGVVKAALKDKGATEVHHGDCIGADVEFHALAKELGIRTVAHPPKDATRRAYCEAHEILEPKPFLVRNAEIVEVCDYLIAAPYGYKERLRGSGTWATIRMARAIARPHGIAYPGDNTLSTSGAR